ncbi:MAG: argininosuccinate lyase [Bryobacterales bacterium]|jgi:argininosuccinate lyase|nr:argininosuccinate lyase [Bryobacterales bacterium]
MPNRQLMLVSRILIVRWLAVGACAVLLAPAARPQPAPLADPRLYDYLIQQNQAQLVVLSEQQLLPAPAIIKLAAALRETDNGNRAPGVQPSANYLDLESQLVQRIGPEASNLHLGRSRNDLGATSERMVLRDELLRVLAAQADARAALLHLAGDHIHTILPGFTHSVQAQPTSLAHFLAAFLSGMERDEQRLREAYARVNASPLGAAAFTTSGFRLDRQRLARLLGFPMLVENSYDAIMVSTVDSKAEVASALSVASLNVGRFAQQFLIQYSDSHPGLNLTDEAVGHSSIMPQKRNPRQAERLRILASSVLGDAQTVLLTAHNTPGGESADIRIPLLERTTQVSANAAAMYAMYTELLRSIRVDSQRTLSLVEGDYATVTELADTLLREAGVPFRTGHAVAAALTQFGRAAGKRPGEITHADADAIYRRLTGAPLPISEASLRLALSPRGFVEGRRGTGGPQPEEMRRMLDAHARSLQASRDWLEAQRSAQQAAASMLRDAFAALR